ncbi:hypothetical protein KC328_g42 [Hortaea werneckii]|nr:hypothetical protein KC328_g42 [Hortaea werneckii]
MRGSANASSSAILPSIIGSVFGEKTADVGLWKQVSKYSGSLPFSCAELIRNIPFTSFYIRFWGGTHRWTRMGIFTALLWWPHGNLQLICNRMLNLHAVLQFLPIRAETKCSINQLNFVFCIVRDGLDACGSLLRETLRDLDTASLSCSSKSSALVVHMKVHKHTLRQWIFRRSKAHRIQRYPMRTPAATVALQERFSSVSRFSSVNVPLHKHDKDEHIRRQVDAGSKIIQLRQVDTFVLVVLIESTPRDRYRLASKGKHELIFWDSVSQTYSGGYDYPTEKAESGVSC